VLARVALSERPVDRRELVTELFADADDPLGALRWSLADLRRSLDLPGVLTGDPMTLERHELWLDVWALEDRLLPVADIGGALLDGIEPRHCPGFDSWLMLARLHTAARSREELRRQALVLLAGGDAEAAAGAAQRAAGLDPLDEDAQELFVRTLVAGGHAAAAAAHLAACGSTFAREGLVVSAALRAAARDPEQAPGLRLRAAVVAEALQRAGTAALDAGATDAGVETLRRAAVEAARAADPVLESGVLRALGGALVHTVRGSDGEGAVVLHRALLAARAAGLPGLAADVLQELAFVDVQAGRHDSADRALDEARRQAAPDGDPALLGGVLGLRGMNEADRGRHLLAASLLGESADLASRTGRTRQESWSLGLLARSLLLSGQVGPARTAAERSVWLARREHWNAFLPLPQVLLAQCSGELGHWEESGTEAERAFALACELGDPCWEGLAGRQLALVARHRDDRDGARSWLDDARRRCDRVPDRYVWVSGYIGLAQLELAAGRDRELAAAAAARLYDHASRHDLPEFLAWALVCQAEAGDRGRVPLAVRAAAAVDNPVLAARARALAAPSRVADRIRRRAPGTA